MADRPYIFLDMADKQYIFWRKTLDAGAKPMQQAKIRVPPPLPPPTSRGGPRTAVWSGSTLFAKSQQGYYGNYPERDGYSDFLYIFR